MPPYSGAANPPESDSDLLALKVPAHVRRMQGHRPQQRQKRAGRPCPRASEYPKHMNGGIVQQASSIANPKPNRQNGNRNPTTE